MGETNGEGVRLVGCGIVAETEEGAGHKGDLLFFGGAFARGRFFDQLRRVFMDGEATPGGGEEGGSSGGPEDDGGAGVLDVDDQFDGEGLGGVLEDKIVQAVVNLNQAFVGGAGSRVFDGTGGQDDRFFGGALKDGVAGGTEGGVESEDPHRGIVPSGGDLSREGRFDPEKTAVKMGGVKQLAAFAVALLPFFGVVQAQTNDATAGGAVKQVPAKKSILDGARTVNSGSSTSSSSSQGNDQVEKAVANPEEEQARSVIKDEDNSPDVGMFVVMANRGWDSVNPASPNKPPYQEVIQERGTAPTFSNNMMDSPDGSQRPNDGWKLFGWTY